jgi:pSer/pThr/pTyr-binding forkhead associated (FHA) protein
VIAAPPAAVRCAYMAGFQLQSVGELQARLEAERSGAPFLLFRDGEGRQQLVRLPADGAEVVIGRNPDQGIELSWDPQVSRVHAVLERIGGVWTVEDDGLSRNGTSVNGVPLNGRRRLRDEDVLGCGGVSLQFRAPEMAGVAETLKAAEGRGPDAHGLTPAQRRVLVALCRPLRDTPYGAPATNKQIAAELTVSVDAVKTHLRRIAEQLELGELPQNRKRAELAWKALSTGVITPRELLSDR